MTDENGRDDNKSIEIRLDDHIPPLPTAVTVTKKKKKKRAPKPRPILPPQRPVIGSIGHSARQLLNEKALDMYSDDESVYLSDNNEEVVDADAPIGRTSTSSGALATNLGDREKKYENSKNDGVSQKQHFTPPPSKNTVENPSIERDDSISSDKRGLVGSSKSLEIKSSPLTRTNKGDKVASDTGLIPGVLTLGASEDVESANNLSRPSPSNDKGDAVGEVHHEPSNKRKRLKICLLVLLVLIIAIVVGVLVSSGAGKSPGGTGATPLPASPQPTKFPSFSPSSSVRPSLFPTLSPSPTTTPLPSTMASARPSSLPSTAIPTATPSIQASESPTKQPSSSPTTTPSVAATARPPTLVPTVAAGLVWINNLTPFFGDNFPSTQRQTDVLNQLALSDNWEPDDPSDSHLWMERFVLSIFYEAAGGDGWNLSGGWRNRDTGVCDWFGVSCDSSDRVVSVMSQFNGLDGSLPSEIGLLGELRRLGLQSNQLRGTIPREVKNLRNLEWLDLRNNLLEGSVPAEVKDLASRGTEVLLRGNQLDCRDGIPNLDC